MGTLIISRSSEKENKLRNINILIDGKNEGIIKDNGQLIINVKNGLRTIKAKIDWCSSNEVLIEINEDSKTYLHLSSGSGHVLYRIIFNSKGYLNLKILNP